MLARTLMTSLSVGVSALCLAPSATAEASIFELRITNNTDTDLTFKLQDGHSKHVHLTLDKNLSALIRSKRANMVWSVSNLTGTNVTQSAAHAHRAMAKSILGTPTIAANAYATTITRPP